jgi:hypothetical protein
MSIMTTRQTGNAKVGLMSHLTTEHHGLYYDNYKRYI